MKIATSEQPEYRKIYIPITPEYLKKAKKIAIMERRTPNQALAILLESAIDQYIEISSNSDLKERRN